jgi:potassium efflux system protein
MAVLVLLGTISNPSSVTGQDAPSATTSRLRAVAAQSAASLSLDELRLKRAEVEASQSLDAASKDRAIKLLDQAIGFAEARDEFNRLSQALSGQIKSAPQRIKTIQSELAKPFLPPQAVKTMAAKKNALGLNQRLQKEQAQLAAAKDLQAAWNDQVKKQKDLLEHLPKDIADAKARLRTVNEELQAAGDPGLVTESRSLMLRTEQFKLKAEIKVFEQQLNSHELLVSLSRAERDLAEREIAEREELIKAWQAEATARIQEEAAEEKQAAEEARDKAPELAQALKDQYDINIALSVDLEELSHQVTAVTKNLDQVSSRLQEIEEDFALATARVETLVLTETVGLALRRQRQLLPKADKYRHDSSQRKFKMSEIREIQYRLERQRRELTDTESETDKIIDSLVYLTPEQAETQRSGVRNLLADRRKLLEKLQTGYNQYFKSLQNLEFAEQQLVARAEEYAKFLDAHLVWIRSSSIINLTDLKNSIEVLQALVNPANWRLTAEDALDSFSAKTGLWILGLLISAVLLLGRRWAKRKISRTAETIQQHRKDSFVLTLWTLSLTCYLAIGLPFLMLFVAWQLLQLPGPHDFTHALATGLAPAAIMLAVIWFFYNVCRRDGLAHIHFNWAQSARQSLRRNLTWILPVAPLMAFLVSAMAAANEIEFGDSTAKLALIVLMIASSVFLGWALRFSGGIVSMVRKKYPTGWLVRLRYIWWPATVGLPIFVAVLTASGYFLSALELQDLIRSTMLLMMVLIVLNSLALRWLTLARRRFARHETRRKAEEKREENLRKQAEKGTAVSDETGPGILHPEPEIGLAEIDGQTKSLLRTVMFFLVALGLWAIWEPVFPALGILQDVHLWSYSEVVDGVTTAIPISLANLVMAVVVVVIMIIASRNLPGLLEITILNRLPMDAGARYAFTTLCRYTITAIGIILAFNTIGFRWSSVQWLVAALGVGLGFGLQEIVANFICGLIILFERPFKPGDTVTIGDISGTVLRRRGLRATTILDWDRKELVVPNKSFITGNLINWSLSDPMLRFVTKVGIAYGSDIELAEKILLRVLNENPMVVNDPQPSAYFLGFGDNSLNFELRSFIDTIDHMLPAKHELHKAIDREFRKAGIVIAFPQRDVHFDTDQPLKVQMVPDKAEPTPDDSEPEPESAG